MPFDGIVMNAVCSELKNTIMGSRIEKISQPAKDEVILQLHSYGKGFRLVLSANAVNSRVHLTQNAPANPATPPNFCILLRKYLAGGRITGINQPGMERILEIFIEGANEIGDITTKILVIEVMGKHSNIILLNNNRKIIDSIKHIDSSVNRLREILPGRDYSYPETQDKLNPLEASPDSIRESLNTVSDSRELEKRLVSLYTGISPFFARKLVDSAQDELPAAAVEAFYNYMQKTESGKFNPCVIYEGAGQVDFHCFFGDCSGNRHFSTISSAADAFYTQKNDLNKIQQFKSKLSSSVSQKLEKCTKKINIQYGKLEDVSDMDNLKLYGELLTSNLYMIKDSPEEVKVLNYYANPPEDITIKLDSNISPSRNAQKFFKKYNKAKSTSEAANKQLHSLLPEKSYLENLLYQIEQAEDMTALSEINDELVSEGIISLGNKKVKQAQHISEPYQFVSTDGFVILAGKNNRLNDRLTLKLARKSDLWLHTRNIPGSHVIIKTENRDVPDSTLHEAAVIASYYSKARLSSNVPVDYTAVRNVKKPTGAKPGFVIYENFKTINVTPVQEVVEKLDCHVASSSQTS